MRCARRLFVSSCLGLLALALLPGAARAQNGTNYHILTNGFDTTFLGVGAGGAQTAADGLGTWIAGEDLRGSHKVAFSGDFGYRINTMRENAAVLHDPVGGGQLAIRFAGLFFVELDGLNGNDQSVFLNPRCPSSGPSFPLGNSGGFIPYGTGPGSMESFVIANVPVGVGPTSSAAILLPNNGLVPSSANGTATVVFSASNISLPINSVGFTWGVQFTFNPSSLALSDDIDGLWHYTMNSADDNEYWAFSDDETNVWQSNTVGTDNGLTALVEFPANADYDLLITSPQPETTATLAPVGLHLAGPYYTQTANVQNEFGVSMNPNGGFDVGRGSAAISISGTAGVPNPTTGLGNQNPSNNPGTVPTLGFLTWDNGGDGNGSVRLTWVSVDVLGARSENPALDAGILEQGGSIRAPVVSAGFLQAITRKDFKSYGHVTQPGYPDPDNFQTGAFGVLSTAGASWQIPASQIPVACMGLKVNLTYGTSGLTGVLGAPGHLTFDPSVADISGTREIALLD
jgi:hypothetical protein